MENKKILCVLAVYDGQIIREGVLTAIAKQTLPMELMVVSRPGGELGVCLDIIKDIVSIKEYEYILHITCGIGFSEETWVENLVKYLDRNTNCSAVGIKEDSMQEGVLYRREVLKEQGFSSIEPYYIEKRVQPTY